MIEWFETHAHLCDPKFDDDRDEVIRRAFESGISRIVEIADGPDEWEKARALAEKYPGQIWWAAGLHPYYADQGSPEIINRLRELSHHPQFVAIGEVGLDFAKCQIPVDVQKNSLMAAMTLASEVEKPLIIHCREAYHELLPLFRSRLEKKPPRSPGVIHCFSGSGDEARELIEMGFFLGVDGPVTYPNSKKLREALRGLPPEKLVIETDSPYLPPQKYRGLRNESSYLPLVGHELAALLNIPPEKFATISRQNSNTLFRLN